MARGRGHVQATARLTPPGRRPDPGPAPSAELPGRGGSGQPPGRAPRCGRPPTCTHGRQPSRTHLQAAPRSGRTGTGAGGLPLPRAAVRPAAITAAAQPRRPSGQEPALQVWEGGRGASPGVPSCSQRRTCTPSLIHFREKRCPREGGGGEGGCGAVQPPSGLCVLPPRTRASWRPTSPRARVPPVRRVQGSACEQLRGARRCRASPRR